jgi:hypothetical protein
MKAWSTFVRGVWWLVEPGGYFRRLEERAKLRAERRLKILESSTSVKEFVRDDGRERIRIFRCPNETFGAVVESSRDHGIWIFDMLLGPGAVFDSVEAAELEADKAMQSLGWKKNA